MRAHVLVVHDDHLFTVQLMTALRLAGHDVTAFADPIEAWDYIAHSQHVDVLVTRVDFPRNRSNGAALAMRAHIEDPNIQVLFTTDLQWAGQTDGLGTFMQAPITVPDVVKAVADLLASADVHKAGRAEAGAAVPAPAAEAKS